MRFVGIPVARLKLGLFVSSGVLAAVAGVVYAARFASTRADAAVGFELDVIAAALLGGVSIFGGRGISSAPCSGVLLGLVRGALNLMDVPVEVQLVVVGMLLVGSVLESPTRRGRCAIEYSDEARRALPGGWSVRASRARAAGPRTQHTQRTGPVRSSSQIKGEGTQ